jgi:hypothetical protein
MFVTKPRAYNGLKRLFVSILCIAVILSSFMEFGFTSDAAYAIDANQDEFYFDISYYYTDALKETYPYLYIFRANQTGLISDDVGSNGTYKNVYAFCTMNGSNYSATSNGQKYFFVFSDSPLYLYTGKYGVNGGRATFVASSYDDTSTKTKCTIYASYDTDVPPYTWSKNIDYELNYASKLDATYGMGGSTFSIAPDYCSVMTNADILDAQTGNVIYRKNINDATFKKGYNTDEQLASDSIDTPSFAENTKFYFDISDYYTSSLKETYPYLYVIEAKETGLLKDTTVSNTYSGIYAFAACCNVGGYGGSTQYGGSNSSSQKYFFVVSDTPLYIYSGRYSMNGGRLTFVSPATETKAKYIVYGSSNKDTYPYVWGKDRDYTALYISDLDNTYGMASGGITFASDYCNIMSNTPIYDVQTGKLAYARTISDKVYQAGYNYNISDLSIDDCYQYSTDGDSMLYTLPSDSATGGTSSSSIICHYPSAFTVVIPKSVTLSSDKDAEYNIAVNGSIRGDEVVVIKPSSSVIGLSEASGEKKDITGTITQSATKWTISEISAGTTKSGTVSVPGLTAGVWTGKLSFTIKLEAADDTGTNT